MVRLTVFTDRTLSEVVERKLFDTEQEAIAWCKAQEPPISVEPPFGPDQRIGTIYPFTPNT
jgi:hypothetical protein